MRLWPKLIAVKRGDSFDLDDRLVIRDIEFDAEVGYFYIIVTDHHSPVEGES